MSSSTAQAYVELFNGDRQATLALLTCSAALLLDDETACSIVNAVAPGYDSTERTVRRVKNLGCVWREANGFWHVTDDVRPHLVERLYEELPAKAILSIRTRLAKSAGARAARSIPDSQAGVYFQFTAKFEAAYQRLLIPKFSTDAGRELGELWRQSPAGTGRALARSVDYLADELERRLRYVPDEVLFLRGIAAQDRKDLLAQEKFFGEVWRRGLTVRPSYIHAQACRFYALLVKHRDPATAEVALKNSIEWTEAPHERGLLYHQLGSLLARNTSTWQEAEQAYEKSLTLLHDSEHRTQVRSSLKNLRARNQERTKAKTKDYPNQGNVKQQQAVNYGQRQINGALCYVDWHVIKTLKVLSKALEDAGVLTSSQLEEVLNELDPAYQASARVPDIDPPGCGDPELHVDPPSLRKAS